jgi:putative ABC transport system permease protein
MDFFAIVRIALNALQVNKLRATLTMLGIIIGVGAVIAMIAIGKGAQARVEEQIKSLGSNLMIILPGSITASGVRTGSGGNQNLTEDDAYALQRDVEEIHVAAPSRRGSGQLIAGNANWSAPIQGVTPEFLDARDWSIEAGRGFEPQELSGAGKVAIIGQSTARQLFGDGDPLDQTIRVRKVPFKIVGVLAKKGQSMNGQDQDDIVLVPLSTARNRLFGAGGGKQRRIDVIHVQVKEGYDMKVAEERIKELLRQRHKLQPGQEDDFTIRNLTEIAAAQEASTKVMTLLLASIAAVSLVVGGIGIMNIMLVSVTERTREIGLRMAVGARGRDILNQFLIEAVTLSLIGGFIGILIGVGGSFLVGELAGWRTELNIESIVLAVGFSAAVGIFFGFYPARKASQLLPIDALRYE